MPASPVVQALLVLVLSGVCFAVWKGSIVERVCAGIVLANVILGAVASDLAPPQVAPYLRLTNDALTAFAMLAVTLRYANFWLGVVLIFYAAQFSLHSYYFVMERPTDRLHAVINNINFMGIVLSLTIGTAMAWRARVKRRRQAQTDAGALN